MNKATEKKVQLNENGRRLVGRIRAALMERQIFGCEVVQDEQCGFLFRVIRAKDKAVIAGPKTLDGLLSAVQAL